MQRVTWRVVRLPGNRGYAGEVTFPDIRGWQHTVKAQGSTKVKAVQKASSMASKLLNDPTVMAMLPPGAGPALQAVSKIASSKLAKAGLKKLRSWF